MKKVFLLLVMFFLFASCTPSGTSQEDEKAGDNFPQVNTESSSQSQIEDTPLVSPKTSAAKAKALENAKAKLERENNELLSEEEVLETIAEEYKSNPELENSEITASGNKVFLFPYPHKCEILGTTTYYYPEKAMEFTGFTTSGVSNNTLHRDGFMYSWAIVESANLVVFAEKEADPGVYSDEEMKENFSDGFNEMVEKLQAQYKDSCMKWELDESLFELPEGVNFEEA